MSLRDLLADLAASAAAGFAEEIAEAIKQEARELPSHPAARGLGREIAGEFLGRDHGHVHQGEVVDDDPELIERPLLINGQPVVVTEETLRAYQLLKQQGRLP